MMSSVSGLGGGALLRGFLLGALSITAAMAFLFLSTGAALADDGCRQSGGVSSIYVSQQNWNCHSRHTNLYTNTNYGYASPNIAHGALAYTPASGTCAVTSTRVVGNSTQIDFTCNVGIETRTGYPSQYGGLHHNYGYGSNVYNANVYGAPSYGGQYLHGNNLPYQQQYYPVQQRSYGGYGCGYC